MSAPVQEYVYRVTDVKEVHDGDTVRLQIDQGLGDLREFWGRLRGIDTWELSDPNERGIAAREYLKVILEAASDITIQTFKTKSRTPHDLMTFGRYVCDIWVDGHSVEEMLRENGFAKTVEHLS